MHSMLNLLSRSIFSLSLALILLAGVAGLTRAQDSGDPDGSSQTGIFGSVTCFWNGCGGQACGATGLKACIFKTFTITTIFGGTTTYTDCDCH